MWSLKWRKMSIIEKDLSNKNIGKEIC